MATFDAQAKAAAAEGKYPPFTFRGLDGVEYSLPHPMTLTEHQGGMIASGAVNELIRQLDEKAFDAIQAMPMFISSELATAWLDEVGDEGKADSPSSETPTGGGH